MEMQIWLCCFSLTFCRALNGNVSWLWGSPQQAKQPVFCSVPLCSKPGFPCWLFKNTYFTCSFLSCPPSSHQTLKNLKVRNTSRVLVSFSSESKPNVKASHCGIRGRGRNSMQFFSCSALPFLVPFREVTCRAEISA